MVATASIDQEVGPIQETPEIHSDRTLYLDWLFPKFTATDSSPSPEKAVLRTYRPGYAFLDRYVRPLETAEKVTVFSYADSRGMQGGAEESHLRVMLTDGAFWEVFRFDFRQGRPYGTEEVASGDRVAVIRAGFSRRFFGSEEVVGKSVPIDGENYRVVGVVTDVRHNYFYRERGMRVHADVWVPVTTAPAEVWRTYTFVGPFRAAVLARRPADIKRIRAEFAAVLEQVEPPPDERFALTGISAPLVTKLEEWGLRGRWKKDYRSSADGRQVVADYLQRRLLTLGGYMLLFLLLPALHLVNLSIGRIEERTSEIGVRKSFGASDPHPGRAVRRGKRAAHPDRRGAQPAAQLGDTGTRSECVHGCRRIDPHILLRGLARPVLRGHLRSLAGLENGAPAPCPGPDREGGMIAHLCRLAWNRRRTHLLLVGELFLSFLVLTPLVVACVLFAAEQLKPLGFQHEGVWSVTLIDHTPPDRSKDREQAVAEYVAEYLGSIELVGRELRALDQVQAAALASEAPLLLSPVSWNGIPYVHISDEGLEVLRPRLLSGRWFQPEDEALDWTPAVIDQELSRVLFGGEDPLGKVLADSPVFDLDLQEEFDSPTPDRVRVVGVVEDCFYFGKFNLADVSVPGFIFLRISSKWIAPPVSNVCYFLVRSYPGTGPAVGETLTSQSAVRSFRADQACAHQRALTGGDLRDS